VDLTGKTDQEIITIITNAGRTAEKWEAARKNLGLETSLTSYDNKRPELERRWDKPNQSERKYRLECKMFKRNRLQPKPRKDYTQMEGIELSEVERQKAAGICLRYAGPSDREGNHKVKDCVRPIKLEKGTVSYPKAKEYRRIEIAGLELESNEEDDSSSESDDEDSDEAELESDDEDSDKMELEGEYLDEKEKDDQQEEEEERNWWDSPLDSE
jgi:hypothetical protein